VALHNLTLTLPLFKLSLHKQLPLTRHIVLMILYIFHYLQLHNFALDIHKVETLNPLLQHKNVFYNFLKYFLAINAHKMEPTNQYLRYKHVFLGRKNNKL
jgi:hypothetical protein